MSEAAKQFAQSFFHGTKADLKPGDVIKVGHGSNFLEEGALSWTYFSATMDAAIWGAELAKGEGPERIYVVEPTGPIEDDPNLTDKRFPGNPTYRAKKLTYFITMYYCSEPQIQNLGIWRALQLGQCSGLLRMKPVSSAFRSHAMHKISSGAPC